MQQKKPTPKKADQKKAGYSIYIIIAMILVPVIYLMYRNYAIPNKSPKVELLAGVDTVTTTTEVQNSTLQNYISLASSVPNEANYINLGLQYYNLGRFQDCIDATKKALEYNPSSYLAFNNLCSAYNQLGRWDDAIAAGEKALEVKPGDELATNNLKVARDGKEREGK